MIRRAVDARAALAITAAALLIGGGFALSFAPWGNAWASLCALCAYAALVATSATRSGPRRVLLAGFGFGLGWFVVGIGWLYISMHDFGAMPAVLAATAVVLLACYLSIYAVAATWWAARALIAGGPFAFAVVFGAGFVLAEWLRGTVFTGLPWLAIGYAHTDGPLAGYAPLLGVYGVGGIAAGLSALVGAAIAGTIGRSGAFAFTARRTILVALVVAAILGLGQGLRAVEWSRAHGRPLEVRLVQGNVAQRMKFDPPRALQAMGDYTSAVEEQARSRPDLILLPETAWIVPWQSTPPDLAQRVLAAVRASGASVALGLPLRAAARDDGGGAPAAPGLTNSVLALSPDPASADGVRTARYDKRHLVPFGEFIPPGFRWFVDLMQIPLGDFERGAAGQPPLAIGDQRVAANVCYEDAFGEELLGALHGVDGATILANVTNVAWFGRSHAAEQHLQIARMRALETARPMIRATNTGMTAAIDHRGRVIAGAEPYSRTVVAARVEGRTGLTPYARSGNWPALVLALGLLVVAAGTPLRIRRDARRRS
ncbi:MAG: apolipoprotein N-acyltransferase [Burkholderiaceae bacterium]